MDRAEQGQRGRNFGNRGGNQGNRGGNHENRGANHENRGANHENRGANHGNRGGNHGNRGGNHGNRGGNHGNRGGQHGNRDGNQGENRGNWRRNRNHDGNLDFNPFRNRGGLENNRGGYRGNWNGHRGGPDRNREAHGRPEMPQMDWFNMRAGRDQSEDRQSYHGQGNRPLRRDYGGRYGSTASLSHDEPQHSREGNNRSRHRSDNKSHMGFKKLDELSKLEPDVLVIKLTNENTGLEKLYKTDLSNDYIVIILRVLSQMGKSTFQENKATVLASASQKEFMDKLTLYLCELYIHDVRDKLRNKYFWEEQEKFWNDLLNFYENVLQIIPTTACDILPKLVRQTCISVGNIEKLQAVSVPNEIKERLEDLQAKIMLCVEEREKKHENKYVPQDELEPPDDFRQIGLYPTVSEITNRERAFVRPNIVEGKYRSVDHYLDIQFRLLREDFVGPLRNGICDHLDQMVSREHKKIFNVRLYREVRFIKKLTIQDKVTLVVQLPIQKKKIKLENSRRFMFGSLICFTSDNFRSIIFGTVASRDANLIQNGQIAVDILDNAVTDDPYTMVECSVYFEPYYHVLKALQMMPEDKFPLKRYIIDVAPDVNPPSYFSYFSVIEHQNYRFRPLVPDSWPSSHQLELDTSQYKAFQAALTKEFCVIQGPPGTGKTFIGLKVAQVLLENIECWNDSRYPMLVICFTNHALDQFLEGILKYTTKLVRIGGQSKSEKLKGHNIKEMRTRTVRTRDRDSAQLMYKIRSEIKDAMTRIHGHQSFLDAISAGDRVINFKNFEAIDGHIKNSWFVQAKQSDLVAWLMGGRTQDERYEERRRNRMAQIQAQMQQDSRENADSDSDDDFFDAEGQEEREVDDRDEIVIKTDNINTNTFTLITLRAYEEKIQNLEKELATIEMKTEEDNAFNVYDEKGIKEEELYKTRDELEYLKWRMDQFRANNPPPRPLIVDYKRPDILTPNERWGLYFNWLTMFRAQLNEDITIMDTNYRRIYRQYEEVRQIEDTQVMREMLVVGMTTTGAARYQTLLQALKCPIVIVEEAAEVLESHVVVSLTSDCKHLILIGDHQQLRPTTAEFRLAKHYNLDISLFERMVNNKIHCEQLGVQHRMRPEIARLIVPAIYPKLDNHHSVETYPPVHGVTKNLFFITHNEPEEAVADTGSRRNVHEAKFLIKLARHFVLQGYEPQEITILATYSGQMFCLWKERKNYSTLKDVRISVVDNFQGEENKIILLSLVRSNEDANVGFLKTDNRVCVALSRAKEGMYIIGNMDILEKSSHVWRAIKEVLSKNDQFGTHLTLQCQVHPEQLTRVAASDDFNKVTEGGCTQLCRKPLDCGHICSNLCHVIDREHVHYKCKNKCNKILCELDHPCPDRCFEECKPCRVPMLVTLKCGHTHSLPCHMQDTSEYQCPTKVDVELECGHRALKPCHKDIKKFPCPHPCEIRMLCGHACTRKCHIHDDPDHLQMRCFKPCERPKKNCSQTDELKKHNCMLPCYQDCQVCEVKVKKTRSCGHMYEIACNVNVEDIECHRRCKKKLDCGHNCKQDCCDPCGNCAEKVTKIIPECNHKVKMLCSGTPDRSKCREKCSRLLICGHPCDKRCNEQCQVKCEFLVDNPRTAACGHQFKIPCFKSREGVDSNSYSLLQHCTHPCGTQLLCSHTCSGTCGSCAQGRVHATCQEQCGRMLVCGHPCDIPCSEMCQPCNKKCSYRCQHSRCGKKCGEPCTSCKERCGRICEHLRCSRKCGEICDIDACTQPCSKRIKCGHPCIGFCGDPCPPICRICDPENEAFTIIMSGNEDDPEARFVYLEECKHVIESDAMDMWLQQKLEGTDVTEINVKRCPRCKTTLASTQRYSEFIKEAYVDINKVKEKWFGQEQQNEQSRVQLQMRVSEVKNINRTLYINSKFLKPILHDLQSILQSITSKGKRNPVNIMLMNKCSAQVEILEKLIKIYDKGDFKNHEQINTTCIERLDFLFNFMQSKNCRFTDQEISDLGSESKRFEKIVQLLTIEKSPYFTNALTRSAINRLHQNIRESLFTSKKYTDTEDTKNRENLKTFGEAVDKSIKLEEHELKMVVQAMRMGVGHWYKCPNGHLYVIADCGGAVMTSKCNECGARIGGSGHQHLSDNVRTNIESEHLRPRLHDIQRELKEIHKGKRNPLNIISIAACKSQITLIETLVNLFNNGDLNNNENLFQTCLEHFDFLLELMDSKNEHISQQRASDIELEINRFERLVQLCSIEKNSNFKAAFSNTKIKLLYVQIFNILNSIQRYSETNDKTLKAWLNDLRDTVDKSMKITDEERKSIVKAMQESKDGLGSGRWFKCPNGHYYAIGECGGAMQIGKCNECGAQIGGQNHALLQTNQFAGEMDGAAHPAWSNAANFDMRNFMF